MERSEAGVCLVWPWNIAEASAAGVRETGEQRWRWGLGALGAGSYRAL